MNDKQRSALLILFLLACAAFNWPLITLFFDAGLYGAFLGLFTAMGVLTLALGLLSASGAGDETPPKAPPPPSPTDGG